MIKGTHRHMVILKNTESPLFEEAYFILRDQAEENGNRSDIVAEANRIIAVNTIPTERKPKRAPHRSLISFLIGLVTGGCGTAVLFLLLACFGR